MAAHEDDRAFANTMSDAPEHALPEAQLRGVLLATAARIEARAARLRDALCLL